MSFYALIHIESSGITLVTTELDPRHETAGAVGV